MGYVHDTQMSHLIHPGEMLFTAGTWTDTVASNVWYKRRTAADAAATVQIPILILQNAAAYKGCKLVSIDVFFVISAAGLDALAATLYKATLPADGSAMSAASVATSYDTGHDTAGERIDQDEHKMTLTLTTPAWIDEGDYYFVEVVIDGSAAGVIDIMAARANFTLRV